MKLAATTRIIVACLLSASASSISNAQVPGAIVAAGEVALLAVHAEGAQIYECKANSAAQLVWQFREPVAALIIDGRSPLRRSDLGNERWQRDHREGSRSRFRRDGEGHPIAQAGGYVASWDGPTHGRHDDPAREHQRRHG